jgi:hypothetical protein
MLLCPPSPLLIFYFWKRVYLNHRYHLSYELPPGALLLIFFFSRILLFISPLITPSPPSPFFSPSPTCLALSESGKAAAYPKKSFAQRLTIVPFCFVLTETFPFITRKRKWKSDKFPVEFSESEALEFPGEDVEGVIIVWCFVIFMVEPLGRYCFVEETKI